MYTLLYRFNSPEVMDLNSYVANLNDQFQQRYSNAHILVVDAYTNALSLSILNTISYNTTDVLLATIFHRQISVMRVLRVL